MILGTEESVDPPDQVRQLLAGTAAAGIGRILTIDYAPWGFAGVDALFVVLDDIEQVLRERDLHSVGDFEQ